MQFKRTWLMCSVAAVTLTLMTACGGGDPDTKTGPGTGGGFTQSGQTWKMDGYTYSQGLVGSVTPGMIGGKPFVSAVISTSGDSGKGAYTGSAITITFFDAGSTTYTATQSSPSAGNNTMQVNVMLGTGIAPVRTNTYTPASGQIKATKDADGTWHFSTVGTLTAARTFGNDITSGQSGPTVNAIAGSPNNMQLTINDVTAKPK